jgi:hypothetical protein
LHSLARARGVLRVGRGSEVEHECDVVSCLHGNHVDIEQGFDMHVNLQFFREVFSPSILVNEKRGQKSMDLT